MTGLKNFSVEEKSEAYRLKETNFASGMPYNKGRAEKGAGAWERSFT